MKRQAMHGLLGSAFVVMVVSGTAQWWLDAALGRGRYALFRGTAAVAAPLFLVLVGFALGQSYARRADEPWGVGAGTVLRRAAAIVAAAALLEVLVLPGPPSLSAGLLPAIALGMVVAALVRPALSRPLGRIGLLALAVAAYLAFVLAVPALSAWAVQHPALARAVLLEFSPWPWSGLVLVGLVLGWIEVGEATPGRRRRYYALLAILGAAMILGALERAWSAETPAALYFARDVVLAGHWTPRPSAAAGVLGIVLLALAAAHWLTARGRWPAPLVVMGRAALPLYFVQQIVVPLLAHPARATVLNDWSRYVVANVLLMTVLLGLAHAWLIARRALPATVRPRLVVAAVRRHHARGAARPRGRSAA